MAKSRWSALPAARSKAPVLQIRLYVVLGLLLISAAAGIVSTIAWMNVKPATATPQPDTATASATVATDFLLGQPTPIPVAPPATSTNGAQWTLDPTLGVTTPVALGTRELYSLTLDKSGSHGYGYTITTYGSAPNVTYVETDYYVAVTNYGTFDVAVPMYITPAGPELAALPTLLPYTPQASGTLNGLDYHTEPGYETAPAAVATAAQTWAQDYVGNSSALGTEVANPSGDTDYAGLSGFTLISATPIGAVPGTGTDAPYIYLRERLVISPASAKGVTLSMDFDLMLTTPTSGNVYNVVAWGPAGSANSLVPYQTNLATNQ
jgi:hypothetical protein